MITLVSKKDLKTDKVHVLETKNELFFWFGYETLNSERQYAYALGEKLKNDYLFISFSDFY